MLKVEILVMILWLMAMSVIQADKSDRIVSSKWALTVRDGAIIFLENRELKERFVSPPSARIWGAEVHAPDGQGLAVCAADCSTTIHKFQCVEQKASWGTKKDKTRASINTRFEIDPETGDIVVNQRAEAEAGMSGLSWGLADVPDKLSVLVPGNSGQRFGADAPMGSRSFEYPMGWEAQFVLIQGRKGGIIIWAEDPRYRFKNLIVEHHPGRFRLRFESRAFAPFTANKNTCSVTWRITAYKGAWQNGAEIYRRWAERAWHLVPLSRKQPYWVKDISSVVIMNIDIPLLELLAKHLDPERTLLYIPNWRRDGYDRNYPDYTALPEFGPFVEAAHRLGFRVMPHVNYFGCDPKNPLYEQFSKYQLRDPFSGELQWWLWERANPPIKFAYINPASREWRRLFVSRMVELCRQYPVDALHLDQTLVIMNHADGLVDGLSCIEGNIELHRELQDALPNVALSGEGLNETTCIFEAFAQRHVTGIEFVEGTWNDQLLQMAHPISSSILLPYTTMYGYLGLPNPDSAPGVYTAWRRAYERFGVIPTLAWPTEAMLTKVPTSIQQILDEARFFQQQRPTPHFAPDWQAKDLFVWRLADGREAFYGVEEGVVFGVRFPKGKSEIISRRIEGIRKTNLPGSIPGWPAYDERHIFGLDPTHVYQWSSCPRNLDAFHISAMPDGAAITEFGVHSDLARFRIENLDGTIRLWDFTGKAESGVRLSDGKDRRTPGLGFNDVSGACVQREGESLFLHPPWKSNSQQGFAKGLGVTFVEFYLNLPTCERVVFHADVYLKPDAVGKSDGVTFRVFAFHHGKTLSAETHNDSSNPKALALDLTEFRGKAITLRIEDDCGSAGDASYDWALFFRPTVTIEDNIPRTFEIHSDRSIRSATASRGEATLNIGLTGVSRVELTIPNTLILNFTDPVLVQPPFNLLEVSFAGRVVGYEGFERASTDLVEPSVGDAVCGGETRTALYQHPPNRGKSLVDYHLALPKQGVRLLTAIGIRDGSRSRGVGFAVEINGYQVFYRSLRPGDGWVPVEIDLESWAGKTITLTLVTDSMGDYDFDWAVWSKPCLTVWSQPRIEM